MTSFQKEASIGLRMCGVFILGLRGNACVGDIGLLLGSWGSLCGDTLSHSLNVCGFTVMVGFCLQIWQFSSMCLHWWMFHLEQHSHQCGYHKSAPYIYTWLKECTAILELYKSTSHLFSLLVSRSYMDHIYRIWRRISRVNIYIVTEYRLRS